MRWSARRQTAERRVRRPREAHRRSRRGARQRRAEGRLRAANKRRADRLCRTTKAHESQELKTYALSTSGACRHTARRDIALNWNNPKPSIKPLPRIGAETYRQAQLLGKSAEWQKLPCAR